MLKLTHLRHATSVVEIMNKRILIDPVFAAKGTYPPIPLTNNTLRNPLTKFPVNYETLFNVDGVIITHNHNDHFDELAKKVLPKNLPILCQVEDVTIYKELGFTMVSAISHSTQWLGFNCRRIKGTHGGFILNKMLGVSSAYLIKSEKISLYISGDTLLTAKIKKGLKEINPTHLIINGGGATMRLLGRITMNSRDIIKISKLLPKSKIFAVHMDSINHCFDTKEILRNSIKAGTDNIIVPNDNETVNL